MNDSQSQSWIPAPDSSSPQPTSRHSRFHFPVIEHYQDVSQPDPSYSPQLYPPHAHTSRTRVRSEAPHHDHTKPKKALAPSITHSASADPTMTSTTFLRPRNTLPTDEYDLSHEDTRILQDVERAIKLKAQREARVREKHISIPLYGRHPIPNLPSGDSSLHPALHPRHSPSNGQLFLPPTIDFGPSIARDTILQHPVPSSVDNGRSLDWSHVATGDRADRRWSLTMSKRKNNDGTPSLARTTDQIQKLDKLYAERIGGIKRRVSPQTLLKARITQEQLQRRYDIVYQEENQSLDIVQVCKWYQSQPILARAALEKAEPFTWLKHLDNRRKVSSIVHKPRNLSARIVEEYLQAKNNPRSSGSLELPDTSSILSVHTIDHPLHGFSRHVADSSFSLSPPTSIAPSTPKRPGKPLQAHPLSREVSIASGSAPIPQHLLQAPEITVKSPSSSPAEFPQNGESSFSTPSSPNLNPPLVLDGLISRCSSQRKEPGNISLRNPMRKLPGSRASSLGRKSVTQSIDDPSRPIRISFPGREQRTLPQRQLKEVEEQRIVMKLAHSYEYKSRLLETLTAQNNRNRQLVHRISNNVREYASLSSNTCKGIGPHLPRDFVESFSHDPAVVTGSTKQYKDYRAVENIHSRLARQRNLFQTFLQRNHHRGSHYTQTDILDEPISGLMMKLELLQRAKKEIVKKATEVVDELSKVQVVHTEVKGEYYTTLADTSIVYPELSQIVTLEESYKDQYQQIWEFAMSTLTLLLDGITPVWRIYGKAIGEDVRDFLIIPLYRNEFTGEPRRYPLLHMPKRSPQHYFALLMWFALSTAMMILQWRVAVSSLTNYDLREVIRIEGLRWTLLPVFWVVIVVEWLSWLLVVMLVGLEVVAVTWWLGWWIRMLD